MLDNDSTIALAAAVIKQAIKEYKSAIKSYTKKKKHGDLANRDTVVWEIEELERFFLSGWFETLCCSMLSGERIITDIRSELGYERNYKFVKSDKHLQKNAGNNERTGNSCKKP